MGAVTGLTKDRMLAIEAASVVGGSISSGHLVLTKHDGSTIDAGNVVGPAASISSGAPVAPIAGQMFFDSANFAGLTDLMAGMNPGTSTANWLAYGYGYDTGVTFSVAGGGVTCTGTGAGSHFAGINIGGLTAGESYFGQLTIRVPTGSPDVQFTVGYKTSGHVMKIKDQDVTLALAFTADGTSAVFGVEFPGVGPVIVKNMHVWALNQRGYPTYIWDGSGWVETIHMAQKGDIYSRVNTFGDQTINGIKNFTSPLRVGGGSNPPIYASGQAEAGAQPMAEFYKDNSAGGFAGIVIRGAVSATATGRSSGILLKMSSEGSTESDKGWEIASYSTSGYANSPAFLVRNINNGSNVIYVDGASNLMQLLSGVATANIDVGAGTGDVWLELKSKSGNYAGFGMKVGNSQRWNIYKTTTAESGSNVGSDLAISRYSDAGAYIDNVLTVNRANGGVSVTNALSAHHIAVGYDAGVGVGSDNWFRSSGQTGWYNASYNTGLFSQAAGWIETYSSSALKVNNTLQATGEIQGIASTQNQFRAVNTSYGVIHRNDNADYYLLLTASGDPYGNWNTLRPFRINLATGDVYMSHKVILPGVYAQTSTSAANVLIATSPSSVLYRSTASSRRWKHDIQNLTGDLAAMKILDIPVRQFKFNDNYLALEDSRYGKDVPGLIAEEVYAVYPIAAEINPDDGEIDDWNVRMLLPAMLGVLQNLNERVSLLEQP